MASGSPADHLDKIIEQAEEQYYDGDYEGAEVNLRKGVSIAEEMGLDDLRLASILNTLAGVLRSTDREDDALEPSLRAFQILERDMPGDEEVAGVAGNLAQIYRNIGEPEEALSYYQRALDIFAQAETPDHSAMARTLAGMAEAFEDLGEEEKQFETLARAVDLARSGRERGLDVQLTLLYSETLMERNDAGKALSVLESMQEQFVKVLSEPKDKKALLLGPDAAAFEMIKEEFQDDHREPPSLLLIRIQLARVRRHMGELEDDTIANLAPMGTFEGRIYGENSMVLAQQYQQIGVALHLYAQDSKRAEDYAKAEEYYKNSLRIMRMHTPPGTPELEQIISNLAELYEDTGRNPDLAGEDV